MFTTLTPAQLAMARYGMQATAIRNHGMSNGREHAVSMYCEAADTYGLTGADRRHAISWCLAQSGYGGGY